MTHEEIETPGAGKEVSIRNWPKHAIKTLAAGLMSIAMLLGCNAAESAFIEHDKAVRAILGEARGEGYEGMYAVACAIRNRGHLRGVYGATADTSDASAELFQLAGKAWAESEDGVDITFGADHWENVGAFGIPYWAEGRKPAAIIGNHKFYRLK